MKLFIKVPNQLNKQNHWTNILNIPSKVQHAVWSLLTTFTSFCATLPFSLPSHHSDLQFFNFRFPLDTGLLLCSQSAWTFPFLLDTVSCTLPDKVIFPYYKYLCLETSPSYSLANLWYYILSDYLINTHLSHLIWSSLKRWAVSGFAHFCIPVCGIYNVLKTCLLN